MYQPQDKQSRSSSWCPIAQTAWLMDCIHIHAHCSSWKDLELTLAMCWLSIIILTALWGTKYRRDALHVNELIRKRRERKWTWKKSHKLHVLVQFMLPKAPASFSDHEEIQEWQIGLRSGYLCGKGTFMEYWNLCLSYWHIVVTL